MRTAPPTLPRVPPHARRGADLARIRRRNLATIAVLGALLAPLAIASLWVLANVETSTTGPADVVVAVQKDWGPVQIGNELQRSGVIKLSSEFQQLAQAANLTSFAVGRYVFHADSTAREALDTLRGGPAALVPDLTLLLPPGLDLKQIADRVGKLPGKSSARFLDVAKGGTIRSKYEPEGVNSLEGLTWPDTYAIAADAGENQILQKIVAEFDKRADAAGLANAAANPSGLAPYQAIVSASLIQREAGTDADQPLIAAVISNRLKKGMLLQVDATLCYAKGGCPPVPTDADRKLASPYNTYKVTGLPPTPIATVGEKALKAAMNPAPVDYLFYVADKNGKTYYASTQAEHDRNVQKARNAN